MFHSYVKPLILKCIIRWQTKINVLGLNVSLWLYFKVTIISCALEDWYSIGEISEFRISLEDYVVVPVISQLTCLHALEKGEKLVAVMLVKT